MSAQIITALRKRAAEMAEEAQALNDDPDAPAHLVLHRMPVLAIMADEFRALADEAEGREPGGGHG